MRRHGPTRGPAAPAPTRPGHWPNGKAFAKLLREMAELAVSDHNATSLAARLPAHPAPGFLRHCGNAAFRAAVASGSIECARLLAPHSDPAQNFGIYGRGRALAWATAIGAHEDKSASMVDYLLRELGCDPRAIPHSDDGTSGDLPSALAAARLNAAALDMLLEGAGAEELRHASDAVDYREARFGSPPSELTSLEACRAALLRRQMRQDLPGAQAPRSGAMRI